MSSPHLSRQPDTPLITALKYFKGAKSDEERFAVLMVLAKLGSPGDAAVASAIHRAIGVRFLHRLLVTSNVPEGCTPDIFKGVSTSILAGLTQVPGIAASPDVLELVDPLIDILRTVECSDAFEGPNAISTTSFVASLPVQVDTLEVLHGMVATPEGRTRCLRCGLDAVLGGYLVYLECMPQAGETTAGTQSETRDDKHDTGVTVDSQPTVTVGEAAITAVRILTCLIEDADGSGMRCGSVRMVAGITALARCFARRSDTAKFAAGSCLGGLLDVVRGTYAPESATVRALTVACDHRSSTGTPAGNPTTPSNSGAGVDDDVGTRTWVGWVACGLLNVLQSRLDPDGRDMALRLAALTTEFCGGSIAWTLGARIVSGSVVHPGTALSPLLPLLVQISRVELRMACEDRTLEQISHVAPRVVCCLLLCEATISWLVALDEQEQTHVDSAMVIQLHSALQECVAAVLSTLDTACEEHYVLPPTAASTPSDPKTGAQADVMHTTAGVIIAGVRLVSVWLAEESEALQDRVAVTLPYMLRLGQQATSADVDLLRPGLCNGTADDALRSIILDNNGIVMVMSRMQQSWIPDLITHHTPSTRESTVEVPLARTVATACQMLLNVLVLQPEYVRSGEPTSLCDNILGVTAFGIQRLSFETFPIVFANLVVVYFRVLVLQRISCAQSDAEWQALGTAIAPMLAHVSKIHATKRVSKTEDDDEVSMLWILGKDAIGGAMQSHSAFSAAITASLGTRRNVGSGNADNTQDGTVEMKFLTDLLTAAKV